MTVGRGFHMKELCTFTTENSSSLVTLLGSIVTNQIRESRLAICNLQVAWLG